MKEYKPLVSFLIPTLNSGKVLEFCLESIFKQDYPKNKIETIIADGGSTDNTLEIAKKYGAKIYQNPLKTGESGKAVALRHARGELMALIDSDNILPNKNWLRLMIKPFKDIDIIVSEPIEYSYRRKDPCLTRYFALLGMNDPICLFIGNYDRFSVLTGKWTNLKFPSKDKGTYIKVELNHEPIPTIGANGTIFRREIISGLSAQDYIFDIDVLLRIMRQRGKIYVAKVKTGIVHTFVENNIGKFFRKQLRRIEDMSFYRAKKTRSIDWEKLFFWKIVHFQIQCFLIFPILYQTIKGLVKKPDICWFFHPVACYSTWLIYLYGWIKGKIRPAESNRANWKQ
jgi:glycosyltransferase involved in cell wall biosynthesis